MMEYPELWLLAQRSNWSRMGDRFSGSAARLETGEMIGLAALVIGAAVLIWGLHWLSKQEENWFRRPSPRRLFRELCRTHGLKHGARRRLKKIAAQAQLVNAVEIFLRPDLVEDPDLAEKLFGDLRQAAKNEAAGEASTTPTEAPSLVAAR